MLNELLAPWRHEMDEASEAYEERLEDLRQARRADEAKRDKDAGRYRWLREHFRFANDSMRELWFDPALEPDDAGLPVDLDQGIDAAMNGANAGVKRCRCQAP